MAGKSAAELRAVAASFALPGRVIGIRGYGAGLINDTFLVTTDAPAKAILQRINRQVFAEPERVQSNLRMLVDHAAGKNRGGKPALRLPGIVPATDGLDYHRTAAGDFWRMLSFIDDSVSTEVLVDAAQAGEVGAALGRFHALVDDLPPDLLHDTLPGFHVTPGYLRHYDRVADAAGQGDDDGALRFCREFVEARRAIAPVLEDARQAGLLRTRVIHGDPKFSNVLFDRHSGRAISLIDLDTVKPGLIHYDLGDCLRSCCNRSGESGQGEVRFDLECCRSVLSAYFAEAGAFVSDADIALLYEAIRLIPFELGLRFLTDHWEGNVYFKVGEEGENLRRAQVQFRLVESIERQQAAIEAVCRSASSRRC